MVFIKGKVYNINQVLNRSLIRQMSVVISLVAGTLR